MTLAIKKQKLNIMSLEHGLMATEIKIEELKDEIKRKQEAAKKQAELLENAKAALESIEG